MVYIGTVDACWINRMLAGCQVQIDKRECDLLGDLDIRISGGVFRTKGRRNEARTL